MIKIFEKFNEPEIIEKFWDNGQKKSENWSINNKYHREDGPAYQEWYENGQKQSEGWWLNGRYHREDGPSVQWWYKNGQKWYEYWYLNNKWYRREKWVEQLKKIGSPHYEEQRMLLDMEKYNI